MLTLTRRFVTWRWYPTLVLAAWVFTPEVRRLYDWQTSYHALSVFAVVPMLLMLPAAIVLPTAWSRAGKLYRQISWLWFLAFAYAFGVALVSGIALSALYNLAMYLVPFLFGIMLAASRDESLETVFERIVNSMLWMAALTSLYGIYQYVSPPPWDIYWAQNANIESSQGVTAAFSFRIFGTLNSTEPLAVFLNYTLLLSLTRLRPRRWWIGLLLVPTIIAFVLTLVRSEWIALAVGLTIFAVLSPQRRVAFATLGGVVAVFLIVGSLLLTVVDSEGANTTLLNLTTRLQTFSDLSSDHSALSRQDQSQEAIADGVSEPLGQGLGASGGSTKLAGGIGTGIDNGFVARFYEMGIVGFITYEIALLIGMLMTFVAYRRYIRAGNPKVAGYLAAAVSAQIVLFVTEIGTDHHSALVGLIFWMTLFFASGFTAPAGARVEGKPRRAPIVLEPSPV